MEAERSPYTLTKPIESVTARTHVCNSRYTISGKPTSTAARRNPIAEDASGRDDQSDRARVPRSFAPNPRRSTVQHNAQIHRNASTIGAREQIHSDLKTLADRRPENHQRPSVARIDIENAGVYAIVLSFSSPEQAGPSL